MLKCFIAYTQCKLFDDDYCKLYCTSVANFHVVERKPENIVRCRVWVLGLKRR